MSYSVEQAQAAGWKEQSEEFAAFMQAVDRDIRSICGLEHDDLMDYDYAAAFQDGAPSYDVALEVLEANDFPMEEL